VQLFCEILLANAWAGTIRAAISYKIKASAERSKSSRAAGLFRRKIVGPIGEFRECAAKISKPKPPGLRLIHSVSTNL
jgi:hypothetical protein